MSNDTNLQDVRKRIRDIRIDMIVEPDGFPTLIGNAVLKATAHLDLAIQNINDAIDIQAAGVIPALAVAVKRVNAQSAALAYADYAANHVDWRRLFREAWRQDDLSCGGIPATAQSVLEVLREKIKDAKEVQS